MGELNGHYGPIGDGTSEHKDQPQRMRYEDFMRLPMEAVQKIIATTGLILVDVRPWDIFTQQGWVSDVKRQRAASASDARSTLHVPAYAYEFPTREGVMERRVVMGDGHHSLLERWQPYASHPRGEGIRLNIEIREVRSAAEVLHDVQHGAKPPYRLTQFRNAMATRRF